MKKQICDISFLNDKDKHMFLQNFDFLNQNFGCCNQKKDIQKIIKNVKKLDK